jgi:predicted transcriptional regulator
MTIVEEEKERHKREDLERWQRFLETGEHIEHAEMIAWLNDLAKKARTARD